MAFFFNRWPALLDPLFNRRLVSLARAFFRLLCAPLPALEKRADVPGMIADAELAFDQHGDTLAGPQIAAKAVCLGPLLQPRENLALLRRREPRLPARGLALAQRFGTAAVAGTAHPLTDGSGGHPEGGGDLALTPALLMQFPGPQAPSLAPSRDRCR